MFRDANEAELQYLYGFVMSTGRAALDPSPSIPLFGVTANFGLGKHYSLIRPHPSLYSGCFTYPDLSGYYPPVNVVTEP